ncbi:MAG: ketopantoate reductase family protein [Mariprofundus sp.]|nr:ketopantoate reductase family protein [Mariprofundus sp.]
MKIGFAGAGAVGCHYGSKLQQAGFDVLLLARGSHLKALQAHGLRHESENTEISIAISATGKAEDLNTCQVIILCCKMTGLSNMLSTIQPFISPDTLLVTLQNGVEAPDLLRTTFPNNSIAAGSAFIGARIAQPGHIIHSAAGGIRMGLWQTGSGDHYLHTLMEAFQRASVPIRIDSDPAAMLWRKLLWNCGFNAITAITRRYAHDTAANHETLMIVEQAMQETVALAQSFGINLGDGDIHKHIDITLSMGPVKTSMWQDIEAGHTTEVNFINGYVARKAEKKQLPATANRFLTTLIHAIEQNHH